jgi:hypothetical protein
LGACCAGSGYASCRFVVPVGDLSRLANGGRAGRLELHRFIDVDIRGGELRIARLKVGGAPVKQLTMCAVLDDAAGLPDQWGWGAR